MKPDGDFVEPEVKVCIDSKKGDGIVYYICENCGKDICINCYRNPAHLVCLNDTHIGNRVGFGDVNLCCRCKTCISDRSALFFNRSWCRYQRFCSTCKINFDFDYFVDR